MVLWHGEEARHLPEVDHHDTIGGVGQLLKGPVGQVKVIDVAVAPQLLHFSTVLHLGHTPPASDKHTDKDAQTWTDRLRWTDSVGTLRQIDSNEETQTDTLKTDRLRQADSKWTCSTNWTALDGQTV